MSSLNDLIARENLKGTRCYGYDYVYPVYSKNYLISYLIEKM